MSTQLSLFVQPVVERAPAIERPGFAWRCLACPWRSRSRGPVAHDHVRTHHIVTGHALGCREIVA